MSIHHKIYIAGGGSGSSNWLNGSLVYDLAKATLVIFTGGQDINSNIYGKRPHPRAETYSSRRDTLEKAIYTEAVELGIPCVGICRGAQLICALNGGILVQHSHHPVRHKLETFDGKLLEVNSCHHQRAYPFVDGCDHKLIAWAPLGTSPFNHGESPDEQLDGKEAEIVFYPETFSLGIQHHPEWMHPGVGAREVESLKYMVELVDDLVEGRL